MIQIEKLSASSIQDLDKCEILFFLKYVLGYQDPSGDSACKGTVCHDVLEAIAICEMLKSSGQKTKKYKSFGILRQKYSIETLFDKIFEFHKKQNQHLKWQDKDKEEAWSFLTTSFGHKFFPDQHHEIIQPERYFRLPITKPWAEFSTLEDGEIIKNNLCITGKIDIVFRDDDGVLNYLDYKFGKKPYDWAKYKDYKYEDMFDNIQLCLYYWAIKQLYTEDKVKTHIWYPRTGDCWTYEFTDEQIKKAMDKVKYCFLKLKGVQKPSPTYKSHCNMCYFRKASFEDLGRRDLCINANGSEKFKDIDGKASACDSIVKFFSARSVNQVIENCKKVKK